MVLRCFTGNLDDIPTPSTVRIPDDGITLINNILTKKNSKDFPGKQNVEKAKMVSHGGNSLKFSFPSPHLTLHLNCFSLTGQLLPVRVPSFEPAPHVAVAFLSVHSPNSHLEQSFWRCLIFFAGRSRRSGRSGRTLAVPAAESAMIYMEIKLRTTRRLA